ncbi:hypothetical protein M569_04167 [Genlisea aurea]|uniref:DCD domain-containing protein n=1 Tax=Genlisea aurea TaxID=192259 RepID=S8CTK1_9LAMI|nr:hypothetical protein M569_04167 [Genlisea aurea]
METLSSFWQLGDDLRGQSKTAEDQKWFMVASKLAEQTMSKPERRINIDLSKNSGDSMPRDNFAFQEDYKFDNSKNSFRNGIYGISNMGNISVGKYVMNQITDNNGSNNNNNNNKDEISGNGVDKRFKTLPAAETLPRNEVLGGYIFVCNNDTMQEDLKRQLFGLPPRYRDSVRAITPGLPLFLYNYTTHQLHGIFEAATFGGSNIDSTAWEDKKCKGESRFPAQVRIRVRKLCKPLEEDAFRPILHHYDGPKFRLELSIPETLDLLDLCEQAGGA